MISIFFKLKEPQIGIPLSKQSATLVYLIASLEYTKTKHDGSIQYISLKYSTSLKIKPYYWTGKPEYRARKTNKFEFASFNNRLDDIENACRSAYRELLNEGITPTPETLRERTDLKLSKTSQKEKREHETFGQFIDRYTAEAVAGERISAKGRPFKLYTLKNFKTFAAQFKLFEQHKGKQYNWNDINIDFYDDFMKFFNLKNYSPNTSGRHIKSLKIVMNAARDEGLHNNAEYNRRRFKAVSVEVQSIYLSEEELNSMFDLDLSDSPTLEVARDVFLIGCYTAQRFSDYSRISKEHIRTLNGGIRVIDMVQEKTGERVIVPIRPRLETILKKYDYTTPKTFEQKLNKRIKEVGKLAKITERVRIAEMRGGLMREKDYFKYELIKTHTARRSGCTNLYLAGIPVIDIMKISGHKTPSEFLKYIKVSKEQTAETLSAHQYFAETKDLREIEPEYFI